MFLQASVILLTRGLPQCMLEYPPPPGPGPPGNRPPTAQSMLEDTVNVRAVRILLECNLVNKKFAFDSLTIGSLTCNVTTGRERLIRTRLIRSSA